jgi:hypothetical protein
MNNVKDTLYRNNNFELSLLFFGDKEERGNFKKKEIMKISQAGNIIMDSFHCLLLGFNYLTWNDEEKRRDIINKTWLSIDNFQELNSALIVCKQWLQEPKYRFLFETDPKGNIVSLGSPPPFNPVIPFRSDVDKFVRFHPAVVHDKYGIKYEGINIENQDGLLASLNNQDFLTIYLIIQSLIRNYYPTLLHLISISNQNERR